MVFFNYALRKLNAKIVYYGPGLCGKTTNLQWIHDHFEGGQRGKMISLSTEGDRTIFFDLLPLEIGSIRGMDVTLQLYTVPGQVHYNSTRQLVLRGADGVVFVADSQSTMRGSNIDSLRNLEENLSLQGVDLSDFPHALQFNKRDLGDLISVDDLDADLNRYSVPFFEAVATDGVGVQETLEGIVKLVMRNLRERYEPVAAAGLSGAGLGPVPLDVEVPPLPLRPAPAPPVAPFVKSLPPLQPRRPLAPPMPAARASRGSGHVGLQDDVPTRVYPEGRPEAADTGTTLSEDAFWPPDRGHSAVHDRPLSTAPSASKEREDFGFAMPFADFESTTDITKGGKTDLPAPAEPPLEGYRHAGDELERVAAALQYEPVAPFDVTELTPEPIAAGSVFDVSSVPVAPTVEPEEVVERPPSWPARLRGTVDELVASVLGTRSSVAAAEAPPSDIPELRDELEAEFAAAASEPALEAAVPGAEPRLTSVDPDWWEPSETETAAAHEFELDDDQGREPRVAEPEVSDEQGGDWFAEPATYLDRGPIEEAAGAVGEETAAELADEVKDFIASREGFAAEERVDLSPPPLAEGDWYEAHTGGIVEAELEPVERFEDFVSAERAPERQPLVVAEPVVAVPEPAYRRSGPITLGEGDPFGDVVDDQPTPVRHEIEPRVVVPAHDFGRLVRAEDNQLHLRLHGTGAIAESGQVRALDIEVPVPGTWVGNRRVTLQLRLTLSPVAEDDDGGSGGAP
jgi:hypothetical protein